MQKAPIAGLALCVLTLSGCTGRPFDLLDAERTYHEHMDAFGQVVSEISDKASGGDLKERLEKQVRVERVSIGRKDDGTIDSVYIVLKTYGLSISGRTVGLIFYRPGVLADFDKPRVRYSDDCNKVLSALRDPAQHLSAVYCRLDENWVAFQVSN